MITHDSDIVILFVNSKTHQIYHCKAILITPTSPITQVCLFGWWFGTFCSFPKYIWDVILPIDELKLFKIVIAPPTRPLLTITNHY